MCQEVDKNPDKLLLLYERALRNCPWSLELWVRQLQELECYKRPHDQIVGKCPHCGGRLCRVRLIVIVLEQVLVLLRAGTRPLSRRRSPNSPPNICPPKKLRRAEIAAKFC